MILGKSGNHLKGVGQDESLSMVRLATSGQCGWFRMGDRTGIRGGGVPCNRLRAWVNGQLRGMCSTWPTTSKRLHCPACANGLAGASLLQKGGRKMQPGRPDRRASKPYSTNSKRCGQSRLRYCRNSIMVPGTSHVKLFGDL